MTNESDPVGTGLVASLARPGGNITGLASLSAELGRETAGAAQGNPSTALTRSCPSGPGPQSSAVTLKETEVAARSLGLKLQFQEVKEPDDLNRAFEAITKARTGALIVTGGPFGSANRKRIVEFAAKSRLPAIYYRARICRGRWAYELRHEP